MQSTKKNKVKKKTKTKKKDRPTPIISVIIPARNSNEGIFSAVESCVKEKDFGAPPFEILIVKHIPIREKEQVMGLQPIVDKYSDTVRCIYITEGSEQSTKGTFNAGIEMSSGEFITFMRPGDTCVSGKLKHLYDFLQQNPDSMGVFGDVVALDSSTGKEVGRFGFPRCEISYNELKKSNHILLSSIMLRKCSDILLDTTMRAYGEYCLWLKLSYMFTLGHVAEPVCRSFNKPKSFVESTEISAYCNRLENNANTRGGKYVGFGPKNPLISVITVCKAGDDIESLRRCMDSVFTEKEADAPPFEYLIVDTNIDEGIISKVVTVIVNHYPGIARHIQASRLNRWEALNLGIAESRGKYVTFLNVDDESIPGKLCRLYSQIINFPNCLAVFGNAVLVDRRTDNTFDRIEYDSPFLKPKELKYENYVYISSILISKTDELAFCEDDGNDGWGLWRRLVETHDNIFGYLDFDCCYSRRHTEREFRESFNRMDRKGEKKTTEKKAKSNKKPVVVSFKEQQFVHHIENDDDGMFLEEM